MRLHATADIRNTAAVDSWEAEILHHVRTCYHLDDGETRLPRGWWNLYASVLICIWRDSSSSSATLGVEAFLFEYGNPFDPACMQHVYARLADKNVPRLRDVARALMLFPTRYLLRRAVSDDDGS